MATSSWLRRIRIFAINRTLPTGKWRSWCCLPRHGRASNNALTTFGPLLTGSGRGCTSKFGFDGECQWRPQIPPNGASNASSARRWPAIPAIRRRRAGWRSRAPATAAWAGAAGIPTTTTGSSASIGSSLQPSCVPRSRRPPNRWRWTRTVRRGASSWPGCKGRSPSAAPSTCCATASGTGRTIWTCSTARRRSRTRRRRSASDRTASPSPDSFATAATRRSGRWTSGCSSTACRSSPSS